MRPSTFIRAAVVALLIGLSIQLSSQGETSWAVAGQDIERQTVPTRTFTPEPVTPTVPAPTATHTPVPPKPTATNTPALPTPTRTGVPTKAQPTLTVSVDTSVYSGPGLDYAIVGSLEAGDTVVVVGRNADSSWWQIRFQGGTGWVPDTEVNASSGAYDVPVAGVPASGTTESEPSVLPDAGGVSWALVGGALFLINGALLLLAGLHEYRRGR